MRLNEIESIYLDKNDELFNEIYGKYTHFGDPDYEIVGNIGLYEIHYVDNSYGEIYALFDEKSKKYVLMLLLYKFGKEGRQIEKIGVRNKYRGLNLPLKLYSWLVQHGTILVSGYAQTKGGRSIWEKLARIPGIFMFGYDVKTKEAFQIDQNDIFNEDVYSEDIENEIKYLEQEYNELTLGPKLSDEEEHRLSKVQKKLYLLYAEIKKIGDYIRLVAIKK